MYLEEGLFAVLSDVHGLRPGRVCAIIGGSIKTLIAGFQQATFIASVDAFFLAANRVGAFPSGETVAKEQVLYAVLHDPHH